MSVLIVKNILAEGPGTIEDFLKGEKIPYKVLELSRGEAIPDIMGYSHLIVMGGPMAVYEMQKYAYLEAEAELIRDFINKGRGVLGICLGAQMIAHALGARVYPGGAKEIGWYTVDITDDGMKDPVFSTLSLESSSSAQVFQWHGDTFDLPVDAVRLASSGLYENQAFRYGGNIYALQFHIEVTPWMIKEWFEDEKDFNVQEMLKQTNNIYSKYYNRALKFYKRFFS